MNRWNKLAIVAAGLLAMAMADDELSCCLVGPNPEYCDSDSQCTDKSRELYDASKPYCHDEGNFCHSGCKTDTDCTIKTAKHAAWYDPARPYCHPTRRDCMTKRLAEGGLAGGPVVPAAGAVGGAWRRRVTLTGDPRVVDGATGARFLQALRRIREHPALLAG